MIILDADCPVKYIPPENFVQEHFRPAPRIGRPTKPATAGQKISLGLKVTPQIKSRLDASARDNGRTQSQEAEHRLERSFDRQDLLGNALSLAYGEQLADILAMLGSIMTDVGRFAHVIRATRESFANEHWTSNLYAFDAAEAAVTVLVAARPTPASETGGTAATSSDTAMLSGNRFASIAEAIRELIGPIAGRLGDDTNRIRKEGEIVMQFLDACLAHSRNTEEKETKKGRQP